MPENILLLYPKYFINSFGENEDIFSLRIFNNNFFNEYKNNSELSFICEILYVDIGIFFNTCIQNSYNHYYIYYLIRFFHSSSQKIISFCHHFAFFDDKNIKFFSLFIPLNNMIK